MTELDKLKSDLKQKSDRIQELENKLELTESKASKLHSEFVYSLAAMGAFYWTDNLRTGTAIYTSNDFFYRMGFADSEIPRTLNDYITFIHPSDLPTTMDTFTRYCNGELESYEVDFRFRRKDGSWATTHNLGYITKREGDEVIEVSGVTIDISYIKSIEEALQKSNAELKAANEKLKHIASTDRLTGVKNRVKIEEAFEREINRAERYDTCFEIALLDIDFFKRVNDTYGHQTGDGVLVEVAKRLEENCRKTDIVGRWGGEEFIIICTDIKDGICSLGEHIRAAVAATEFESVGTITVSVGVTSYQKFDSMENMIKRADLALYEAKHLGRNRVVSR